MYEYITKRFFSDELDQIKRVYVYLPKDYYQSDEFYPVLYMHDGQNLFDDKTAHMNRGWRLMDVLANHPDLPKVIIVGIESDGRTRTNQLIPYPFLFPKAVKPQGGDADKYLRFLVETVKPHINQTYRTMEGRKHTAIMGSSFGGVNSLYAAIRYPQVFGRFACLSSAFHYGFYPKLKEAVLDADFSKITRFYMDTGTLETDDIKDNENYLAHNDEVADMMKARLDATKFTYKVIEGGHHHERDWEERFPDVLSILFEE